MRKLNSKVLERLKMMQTWMCLMQFLVDVNINCLVALGTLSKFDYDKLLLSLPGVKIANYHKMPVWEPFLNR